MNALDLEKIIADHIPGSVVQAKDLTGGGDHWQVQVKSSAFAGLSMVEQHQKVYEALGDLMKKDIHALALNTSTP